MLRVRSQGRVCNGLGDGAGRAAQCRSGLTVSNTCGCRAAALPRVFQRRGDESRKERVRFERLRFEFRVELAAEEPRMVRRFDDFHVILIRRASGDAQARGDQSFFVVAIKFVAVAVALADFEFAVSLVGEGAGPELAWPGA